MNRLKMFLNALAKPVSMCLPLFVWSLYLQSPLLISWLRYAPKNALLMFVNIGDGATSDLYFVILLSLILVYTCYGISVKTHKGGISFKILVYVLLVFTFVARKFLLTEFGLQLSPSTFSLLQETNSHEVSGFLGDYILSLIGLKYLLMMLLLFAVAGFSEWLYAKKQMQRKLLSISRYVGVAVSIVVIIGVPAIFFGGGMIS